MNMNKQKGFSTILGIIILLIIGSGTYFYVQRDVKIVDPTNSPESFVEENEENEDNGTIVNTTSQNQNNGGQGATYVPEEERVNVISPKLNDVATIGETVQIEWNNYYGNQNLNIGLQIIKPNGQSEAKIIDTNVPNTGKYNWIVSSENPDYKYKIEIHPYSDRTRVGRSETFSIIGISLIKNVLPESNSRVDASKPVKITGMARGIFNEGEFDITASYILDGEKQIVDSTYASCVGDDGCDWTSGDFLEFESNLDLSDSPVCFLNISFIARDGRDDSPVISVYELPLWLYGINDCK